MSESLNTSTHDQSNQWDHYDEVLAKNDAETDRLQAEYDAKGPIRQFLGRRALKRDLATLDEKTSQAFIDNIVEIDSSLRSTKNYLDTVRGPEEK